MPDHPSFAGPDRRISLPVRKNAPFCAPTPPSPATYPQNWPYLRTATSFSATYPQNRPNLRTAAGFSAAHPQNRPFLRTASPHPKPSPPGSAGLPPCKQKNACTPPPCRSTGSEVPRQPLPPHGPRTPPRQHGQTGAGPRTSSPPVAAKHSHSGLDPESPTGVHIIGLWCNKTGYLLPQTPLFGENQGEVSKNIA